MSKNSGQGDYRDRSGIEKSVLQLTSSSYRPAPSRKGETFATPLGHTDSKLGYYFAVTNEVVGDRYRIENAIGNGTFGMVYRARDLMDPAASFVAIKFLRQAPQHENIAQRERDILLSVQALYYSQFARDTVAPSFPQLVGAVQSSDASVYQFASSGRQGHVVRLLRCLPYRGHVVLVFPMLGPSLSSILRSRGGGPLPLPLAQARAIFVSLCKGVAEIHASGFIHTDIKPDNILLRDSESPTHAVVIDLGSAVHITESCHHLICTRQYRPPEAIIGLHWSRSADIWSLGCIAYELHMGRLLFRTHDSWEHLALIERVSGPPPGAIVHQASAMGRGYYFIEDPISPTGYRVRWPPIAPDNALLAVDNDSVSSKPPQDYSRIYQTEALAVELAGLPASLVYMIQRCLSWVPDQRPDITRLLEMPYLRRFDTGLAVPHQDLALSVQSEQWNSPKLDIEPSPVSPSVSPPATVSSVRGIYRVILTIIDVVILVLKGIQSLSVGQHLSIMLTEALEVDNMIATTPQDTLDDLSLRFSDLFTRLLPVYGFCSYCQRLPQFDGSIHTTAPSDLWDVWKLSRYGCPV